MDNVRRNIENIPKIQKQICCLKEDLKQLDVSIEGIGIERFEYNPNTNSLDIDFKLSDGTIATASTPLQTGIFKPNIVVDTYGDLSSVTGQVLFEFAEVRNSQGTSWLPGTIGGTYYGSGLYYWNGTTWVHDNDKIYEGIQDLLSTVSNHINNTNNPHQVTKEQVGLSNVDNTSDLDKPISNLTLTELQRLDFRVVYITEDYTLEDSSNFNGTLNIKNVSDKDLNILTLTADKIEEEDSLILYPDESFTIRKRTDNDYRII